jgi:hypothetical protein
MRSELALNCYGAQLLIVDAASAGVCARLERVLPPSTAPCRDGQPDACFVVERVDPRAEGGRTSYRLLRHGAVIMRAHRIERVVDRLRREVDETVALRARDGLFVHAGVVGWRGSAILVPGRSMSGKSNLVDALVRCGATYYSDEFGVLNEDAMVRPYARAPVIRADSAAAPSASREVAEERRAEQPLPVALVVSALYRAGAVWNPTEVRGARAVLPIIDNTVLARSESARLLRLCKTIARKVVTLEGVRGEATATAPLILAYLDSLLDGSASVAPHRRAPAAIAERAHAVRAAAGQRTAPHAESVAVLQPPVDDAKLLDEACILLLHWNGRFGNRMHQYAYGVTYARRNGCTFWLPSDWEGTHLFATPHHVVAPHLGLCASLNTARHANPEERFELARRVIPRLRLINPERRRDQYRSSATPVGFDNVCAYDPGIFSKMSRQHLLSVFEFSAAVKNLDLYKRLEDRQGTYDIAHLRRDDISNPKYNQKHTQGYSVVSRESYIRAFERYGFDPELVEWTSDDHRRQWHTDRALTPRGRWRYPTGSEVLPGIIFDWLEDFVRLYFARTIFRANSSFSWWAAFLSPQARVFSPVLDKEHIYGVDGMEEITVEFVEGNHPHWMFDNDDIVVGA